MTSPSSSQQSLTASYSGIKVFSATKNRDRDALGEKITEWLRANPGLEPVEKVVKLSSDREYHCLSIVVFFRERRA